MNEDGEFVNFTKREGVYVRTGTSPTTLGATLQ